MSNSAVVGYSISYPMGILGLMIAVALMRRLLRVDYAAEATALGNEFPSGQPIVNHTVQVTKGSDRHEPAGTKKTTPLTGHIRALRRNGVEQPYATTMTTFSPAIWCHHRRNARGT
jgi:uncharacterized transporter YbjL